MEPRTSLAEDLPTLYRAILDGIAHLERIGKRREAALVRAQATHVYSGSWDDAGLRRLQQIRRRIDRLVEAPERPGSERSGRWNSSGRPSQRPQHDPA